MAKIFTDCGFDAVTIANNHVRLRPRCAARYPLAAGKGNQGHGRRQEPAEAREPAIVEKNGSKSALGYCSVIPAAARRGRPRRHRALRVKTDYEPRGSHAPARILTEPDGQDMKMILVIAALRSAWTS
jgi:poly-gamma-glutamate synthesis protein (capsule biosynthesis protein)